MHHCIMCDNWSLICEFLSQLSFLEDPPDGQAPVSVMVSDSAADTLKMRCRGSHRSIRIRREFEFTKKFKEKEGGKTDFHLPCSCCGKEWRLLCDEGEGDCDSDDQVSWGMTFCQKNLSMSVCSVRRSP